MGAGGGVRLRWWRVQAPKPMDRRGEGSRLVTGVSQGRVGGQGGGLCAVARDWQGLPDSWTAPIQTDMPSSGHLQMVDRAWGGAEPPRGLGRLNAEVVARPRRWPGRPGHPEHGCLSRGGGTDGA